MEKLINLRILSLTILLSINFSLFSSEATYPKEKLIDTIFYQIYNLQFDLAEKGISTHESSLGYIPSNWLTCELMWWKTLTKNDNESYIKLQNYLENKLENINNLPLEDKLIEMVYLNFLIRLMSIQNKPISMLKYFSKINRFIKEFDTSSLDSFQKNFYNIYRSVFLISKNKFLLFNKENEVDLIEVLKNNTKSSHLVLKTMTQYFLVKIYIDLKKTPELAMVYINDLIKKYPKNKIFQNISSEYLKK